MRQPARPHPLGPSLARRRLAWVTLAASATLVACGPLDTFGAGRPLTAGPLSETHAPLRDPAFATDVPLLTLGYRTQQLLPTPETNDPTYWDGEQPLGATLRAATSSISPDEIVESSFDYARPFRFRGPEDADYDADGNITLARYTELFEGRGVPEVQFEYVDGTLRRARLLVDGEARAETEVLYADGRRIEDGVVGDPGQRWYYRYDAAGRLVARLGGGALGRLPDQLEAAPLPNDLRVPMPTPDRPRAFVGATYYFRDAAGRVRTILEGSQPGGGFARLSLSYLGGRLVRVERVGSDPGETAPAWRDHGVDYRY